jgi:hypothetical protein
MASIAVRLLVGEEARAGTFAARQCVGDVVAALAADEVAARRRVRVICGGQLRPRGTALNHLPSTSAPSGLPLVTLHAVVGPPGSADEAAGDDDATPPPQQPAYGAGVGVGGGGAPQRTPAAAFNDPTVLAEVGGLKLRPRAVLTVLAGVALAGLWAALLGARGAFSWFAAAQLAGLTALYAGCVRGGGGGGQRRQDPHR